MKNSVTFMQNAHIRFSNNKYRKNIVKYCTIKQHSPLSNSNKRIIRHFRIDFESNPPQNATVAAGNSVTLHLPEIDHQKKKRSVTKKLLTN